MKIKYLTILFLLCIMLPEMTVNAQINHKHYILMGRVELSNQNFSEAIYDFNMAITAKPNDFEGYFLRGVAKYSLSDYTGAVEDFTKTIELHPLYVRAYQYRGVANDQLANYSAAMNDFHSAISMDPYNDELHLACGSTRMHLNDYEGAIAEFDTALIINPDNSDALISRGVAKRYIDDLDGAVQDLNLAVYNDYFNVEAVIRRGMIELERENYAYAMTDFNDALKMDADNPFIYFNRAVAHLYLGDTIAALADYEKVNNLDQRNALTYFNRAIIYSMIGEYDVAMALYNKTIEINPNNIYGYFNRGILFYNLKQWDEAEEDFTTVIDLFPDFIDAWVNRAAVRFEKNDMKGAEMDRYHAREIMAFVSDKDANIDSLYSKYAQNDHNKIIRFESDFVSGDRHSTFTQFADITIEPCKNFVVYISTENDARLDATLSQLSQNEKLNGRLAYMHINMLDENFVSNIDPQVTDAIKNEQLRKFVEAIYDLELANFNRGEIGFRSLVDDPTLGVYAALNLGTLLFAHAQLVSVDDNYDNSVFITQKKANTKEFSQTQKTPDYAPTATILEMALVKNKRNQYLWYNLGNAHLYMKDFQRAIDDYTMAIKYDPTLGEAYYNRALTLLYLGKNSLAMKDLSKAGELGITDAYVVMKRFSEK